MFLFFEPFAFLLPFVALLFFARLVRSAFRAGGRRRVPPFVLAPPEAGAPQAPPTGKMEGRLYGLAYRLGGRLSVSDVVIETGLGTRQAEALLDGLVDETHVRVQVTDEGRIRYEFPEILDRLAREGRKPEDPDA